MVAIAEILASTLAIGEVPDIGMVANVELLLKKGGKDKSGNCRPVSLMAVVGRLFEVILRDMI